MRKTNHLILLTLFAAASMLYGCSESSSGNSPDTTSASAAESVPQSTVSETTTAVETIAATDETEADASETAADVTTEEIKEEELTYMDYCSKMISEMPPEQVLKQRDGVTYPHFEKHYYYSNTAERDTPVNVLLPSALTEGRKYPVLYILHGYYDNEDWMTRSTVHISEMLQNLITEGLAEEMIIVCPYIFTSKDMQYCTGMDTDNTLAYDNFINDMMTDLMPFIEENFPVAKGRENTAITGFSMGARESLYIGFTHPDKFGFIGSVCTAPGLVNGTGWPYNLEKDQFCFSDNAPELLLISAAENDGVVRDNPKNYHKMLTDNGTKHLWHTMSGTGHDASSVTPHLYNFLRMIFRGSRIAEASLRQMTDPASIVPASAYKFEKIAFDGAEKQECHILIEAESAEEKEGVSIKADYEGFSGEGYADISDNTAFSLTVNIPASQYYKLTVRHRAGSHKENPLLFNGLKAMDIYSENGQWQESVTDGVFLSKGPNTITLGAGWSWFSLDSILIENGDPIPEEIYENVTGVLCNPYANLKTQNIYQYLKAVYGKRILSGQCTNYGTNTETDAIYLAYDKYPAVRTFDFIFDSYNYCKGRPKGKDVDLAIEWSKEGGLVVFDWHWHAPLGRAEFYTEKCEFKLSDAVTDIDIATLPFEEVQQLCKDGKISKECVAIIRDIDNISTLMQRMEDENVTVMWRPLHEASGGWFWWGADGADAYKWLWRLMFHRMTDYHKLDNLIWVWNAQSADWYPGDEYCDICAIDIYNQAHDYGVSPGTFVKVAGWADNGKLVAMSECATMPDPELIVRDNAYWLWFAVWNWDYIVKNGTTTLSDSYTSFDMMEKVYNSEVVITRDMLPDFERHPAEKQQ